MKRITLLTVLVCVTTMLTAQLYFDIGGGMGMTSIDVLETYEYSEAPVYGSGTIDSESGSDYWTYPRSTAFDLGGKVGYNPFSMPLYLVMDVSWSRSNTLEMSHSDTYQQINNYGQVTNGQSYSSNYTMDLNQFFFGPGFVYYPREDFQLAASFGCTLTSMTIERSYSRTDYYGTSQPPVTISSPTRELSDTGLGYGFNLSSAIDIGSGNSGLLIGGKFQYTKASDLEVYDENETGYNGSTIYSSHESVKFSPSVVYVGLFLKYSFRG